MKWAIFYTLFSFHNALVAMRYSDPYISTNVWDTEEEVTAIMAGMPGDTDNLPDPNGYVTIYAVQILPSLGTVA